jgi:hypothetical protein
MIRPPIQLQSGLAVPTVQGRPSGSVPFWTGFDLPCCRSRRRSAAVQQPEIQGGWAETPRFPLIEKPVACYAYCLRPIHRRANHVRAKAHQHGHRATISPYKIACEQRACRQFQCLPTPLAHYAAEQQSRNHSERHVCEPVIPGPKLQVGSHNVWNRTCRNPGGQLIRHEPQRCGSRRRHWGGR